MPYYKIFAHARDVILDPGDGKGSRPMGFYTGRCIEADDEIEAGVTLRKVLIEELAAEYAYEPSSAVTDAIEIEELEEIAGYDASYDIGKAFYDEDEG